MESKEHPQGNSEVEIPINEFRAKTAEVLRTLNETKAVYVITSHGQPVADLVPHGSAIRRNKGKTMFGAYNELYDRGWDNVPLQEQVEAEHWQWTMTDQEYDKAMGRLYEKYNPATKAWYEFPENAE